MESKTIDIVKLRISEGERFQEFLEKLIFSFLVKIRVSSTLEKIAHFIAENFKKHESKNVSYNQVLIEVALKKDKV